ncbi:MAG: succinylglutamate desuccinylase/aspartoacylase family protein [Planctomycetes bacterium]|nr:succinylglutamate desuccinylase/aspartoacylase family protein [Planctomycetota bacterium]
MPSLKPCLVSTALLALALLAPASAQPLEGPDGWRPPGTRTRTAAEGRRYHTGVDELQPTIGRPSGFRELSKTEAGALLAPLRAELTTPRSLESLLPGLGDVRAVNGRLEAAIARSGGSLTLETIGKVHGLPVHAVRLKAEASGDPKPRLLLLAGVHSGTEKTGFEAATRYVEELARDPSLRAKFDVTIVPLVNPTALVLGTRENAKGVDINRTFVAGATTPESKILVDFVKGKTFDFHMDLHTAGDKGRDGFFLIRGKPDGGLGARIMKALPSAALLDAPGKPGEARVGPYVLYGVGLSEIESIKGTTMDLVARGGTPYVYTFEAPTRADPKVQVDLTMRFIRSALNNAHRRGVFPRVRALTRARAVKKAEPATAKASSLDPYRRADGTLDWGKLGKARALPEIGGLAHFGLALFLKEVAVVTATGDRDRIEEFFEGLLTTDFYRSYGLFVAGARLGEIGYTRALQRFVKPGFVNGILKTNLVLAAGIALPQVVDGTFSGRGFAITLGSLGLSIAAVRAGVRGISWVRGLETARGTGLLSRVGLTRLGKVGGWVYTAAELAVVLYFAEELEERASDYVQLRDARRSLQKSSEDLIAASADPKVTPASLEAALKAAGTAWADYRNFLYTPLQSHELMLAARLERHATQAKVLADRRRATLERIQTRAALRANVERRYGSLEGYAKARLRADEAELQAKVDGLLTRAALEREQLWKEVYEGERRKEALLANVADLPWLLAGARRGAVGDPFGAREDAFARWGRNRASEKLRDALRGVSSNRLQAYQDERALYSALSTSLAGRTELIARVQAASERAQRIADADRALSGLEKRAGMTKRLQGVGSSGGD